MKLILGTKAEYIIDRLNNAGYEAFAVGGCVRDSILGIGISDVDITTSALPQQVKAVFSEETVIETGIKHGTVTVLLEHLPFEITTYRTESGYSDQRHPDKVTFVSNIIDDLARRDFTINAIGYSPEKGIVDPFGGIEDIKNKIIRAVGVPEKRFSEDALRILRALRFSAVLGFTIEKETKTAIFKLSETVKSISCERIYTELKKLVCGKYAEQVLIEYRLALSKILPISGDINRLACLPEDFSMRLAWICGENVPNVLEDLRADNATKEKCRMLVNSSPIPEDIIGKKRYIYLYGKEHAKFVAEYRRAAFVEDKNKEIEHLVNSGECLFISDLNINGKELQQIGFQGREIGIVLDKLLESVRSSSVKNTKDSLIKEAMKMKNIDIL